MMALWWRLLLEANFADNDWQDMVIKRGQLVTSIAKLSVESGLSAKQVRLCLERLKKTGEIGLETTNKYTIITICNYDDYQSLDQQQGQTKGKRRANKGQTEGKQRANGGQQDNKSNKGNESKEGKEDIEKEKSEKEKNDFDVLFDEWLEYKKQRKETYHSQLALDRMKTKLRNLSGNNIETARAIINEAMANNWAGFFALRANTTTPESKADRNQRNEEEAKKILGI
jgi:hypothetical protein